MKNIEDLNRAKSPIVKIDKKLEQFKGKTIFPKKLALANNLLKTAKIPDAIK